MVDEIDDVGQTDGSERLEEVFRRLVHVRYGKAAVIEAEQALHDAVARARTAGATWAQVADALGITEGATRARYDGGGNGRPRLT